MNSQPDKILIMTDEQWRNHLAVCNLALTLLSDIPTKISRQHQLILIHQVKKELLEAKDNGT